MISDAQKFHSNFWIFFARTQHFHELFLLLDSFGFDTSSTNICYGLKKVRIVIFFLGNDHRNGSHINEPNIV